MKLQVQALRLNDAEDRGIEIVSRFASPDNRRFTGPLPRFTAMLHGPRYRPMLNHRAADFGLVQIEGAVARQRVRVATEGGPHRRLPLLPLPAKGGDVRGLLDDRQRPGRSGQPRHRRDDMSLEAGRGPAQRQRLLRFPVRETTAGCRCPSAWGRCFRLRLPI
jgi:hypothetical protein